MRCDLTQSGPGNGRRAIIHVGTEKTGTTSLQQLLADNRDWLRAQGVLFPISAGKVNHTRLVAAAEDDGVIDNIKAHIMAARRETEARLRKTFRADLKQELAGGAPWHTMVLSSELIHSRLHTRSEIERLMSFVADAVDSVTIMVVLRRQDQLAVSRFSTAVRTGHTGFDDVFGDIAEHAYRRLPPSRDISDMTHYYDYTRLIDRFSPYVQDTNFVARLYEADGIRMDPVQLLAEVLDLDPAQLSDNAPSLNAAMSAEAQYVISQLNQRIPPYLPSGKRNEDVRALKQRIEAELSGQPRNVSRDAAKAFLARFDKSNEAVRARFFPDRATLFDSDFSMYPQSVDYSDYPARFGPVVSEYVASLVRMSQPSSALKRTMVKVRRLWAN